MTTSDAAPGASAILRPAYDIADVRVGVAHLGLGAFHRAHQAAYFDDALAISPRFGVCATSLHSRRVTSALRRQNGRYGLVLLGEQAIFRTIGAIREAVDPGCPGFVERVAEPSTHLITLTVTEKGYCLDEEGGLHRSDPGIKFDLAHPHTPTTALGLLTKALNARRRASAGGVAIVSCDNLAGNGSLLRKGLLDFASEAYGDLADWIDGEVRIPNSMVDAITPASDAALLARASAACGFADACAVQREAFSAWVIGDDLRESHPELEDVGVTFAKNVDAHERAKLRMLNGAHSTLAYVGLACGLATVAEAMARPTLAGFVSDQMELELAASLSPSDVDLGAYRKALLERFTNPNIRHRLWQIAMDGSKKLPIRLLPPMMENLAAGRPIRRCCLGLAAWMRHIVRSVAQGCAIEDPISEKLALVGRGATGEPSHDIEDFLALREMFSFPFAPPSGFRSELERSYCTMLEVERRGDGALVGVCSE